MSIVFILAWKVWLAVESLTVFKPLLIEQKASLHSRPMQAVTMKPKELIDRIVSMPPQAQGVAATPPVEVVVRIARWLRQWEQDSRKGRPASSLDRPA